jgi:hypothetical protein
MSIEVPPRQIAGSLQNRQARPLTGIEVGNAIERHILTLTDRLLHNAGLLSDNIIDLIEDLRINVIHVLGQQTRLGKVNVTYPKVGWNVKTRLEQSEDGVYSVNAEVELDLERNVRINLQFGVSGVGRVIQSLEEEKLSTPAPDKDRQQFGMPVEAEYLRPDGTVGKVDINELKPIEKRSARTVDVGSAKVQGSEVSQGIPVVLPSQLPEISLDDIIATPPEVPKEPPVKPLPDKGSMAQVTKPNVKFKGGK